MGLVQRHLEGAGFTTVTLSPIPDLTASVSAPRVIGVPYPCGVPFGLPGDAADHRRILEAALDAVATMTTAGARIALDGAYRGPPIAYPEAPIVAYLKRHPLQIKRFWNRDPPQRG